MKGYLPEFGVEVEYTYQPYEAPHACNRFEGRDEAATITGVTVPALGGLDIIEALRSTERGRAVIRDFEIEALDEAARALADAHLDRADYEYERRRDMALEIQAEEMAMRSAQRGIR